MSIIWLLEVLLSIDTLFSWTLFFIREDIHLIEITVSQSNQPAFTSTLAVTDAFIDELAHLNDLIPYSNNSVKVILKVCICFSSCCFWRRIQPTTFQWPACGKAVAYLKEAYLQHSASKRVSENKVSFQMNTFSQRPFKLFTTRWLRNQGIIAVYLLLFSLSRRHVDQRSVRLQIS